MWLSWGTVAGSSSGDSGGGFSAEQKAELAALVKEAVGSTSAPPAKDQPKNEPQVTDDQWASMSDRQRQSFVTSVVDFRLDELARADADTQRDAKIAELEKKRSAEPERAPSVWTRIQGFLWGAQEP